MAKHTDNRIKAPKDESEAARIELFKPIGIGTRDAAPLYRLVESHLRGLINSGKLVPGDLIPSETELAAVLQVSKGTVKKAIDNLDRDGLIYRHQGKGTYVSSVDFNNSLFRFFTYGDSHGRGVRIHKETVERQLKPGNREVCRWLHVPTRTELLYIERIGFDGSEPVMVERSWWLADIVPGLEDEKTHIPDLLYAVVVEEFGVPVVRAEETLTAEAADARTADQLQIDVGSPLVVLKRTTYTTGNSIIEVRTTKGRADRFSYKAEIR